MEKAGENSGASRHNDNATDISIQPIAGNSKDKIENPRLSKEHVIPRINTSNVFVGTTGMGKSTLVTNLLQKKQFFGGTDKSGKKWFDLRILISPTGDSDDVQKELDMDVTLTDLKTVPDELAELMAEQKKLIKAHGADKAPKICIVYDDVISHPRFMKDPMFIKSFIANRHFNFTVFLCTQSWTKVPRAVRLQARGIFYFPGGISEVELLCDEYCPPGLDRNDFKEVVGYATGTPYSFLYINKSVPIADRFRRNLEEILNIDFFKGSKRNPDYQTPVPAKEDDDKESKTQTVETEKKEEEGIAEEARGKIAACNSKFFASSSKKKKVVTSKQNYNYGGNRRTNYEWAISGANYGGSSKEPQRSKLFGPKRLKSSYHA